MVTAGEMTVECSGSKDPRDRQIAILTLKIELLIPGKFISREGNKFRGTRSGLHRVSILSAYLMS